MWAVVTSSPVNAPELHVRARHHSGGPGSAVDECQLSEAAAFTQGDNLRLVDEDVHSPLLNNVVVVPLVSLVDDHIARSSVRGKEIFKNCRDLVLL